MLRSTYLKPRSQHLKALAIKITNMLLAVHFFTFLWLPTVRAQGWDDFSNNLATDLAPFLSLFGEQITKQYLSESITLLDYLIFAMAPMGILTAVVSAIRVCGSPSLRAFIGRAQEGAGNAEAELCSSTSRDVCELYNNGGITRVFGRPKILEIVVKHPDAGHDKGGVGGIYTFQEYPDRRNEWDEIKSNPQTSGSAIEELSIEPFAPNLSLNVGIKRRPRSIFVAVAVAGVALQTGVLAFAIIVSYHLRWDKDGSTPDPYACPLTIIGTVLVCGGIYFCAYLIGESTSERKYRRKKPPTHGKSNISYPSTMYWIQPGGQVLGDQTFDAFCWNDAGEPLQEYITSRKARRPERTLEITLWLTVTMTISGFVLQFIGLRGLHSAISVAQLGVIMIMSALRAALRMQRLSPSDNFLVKRPDEVVGHELDWLALHIGKGDFRRGERVEEGPQFLWKFTGVPDTLERRIHKHPSPTVSNAAQRVLQYRSSLAQLTESIFRGTGSVAGARNFEVGMVEGRLEAERLGSAMEATINSIFLKTTVKPEWKDADVLYWSFTCTVSDSTAVPPDGNGGSRHSQASQQAQAHQEPCTWDLKFQRSHESPWRLEKVQDLEALSGLWVWSLKSDPIVEKDDRQSGLKQSRAARIPARRIISVNEETLGSELAIWLPGTTVKVTKSEIHIEPSERCEPSTIWRTSSDKPYESATDELPELIDNNVARYFGWYAGKLPRAGVPHDLGVWWVPADGLLVSSCVQDVFGSFFKSILDIADDVGGIEILEVPHFRLNNMLVTEVAEIFVGNDLGTGNNALLCILPAILGRLQVSSSGAALAAAKNSAQQHRRHQNWSKAEKVLKWAWSVSKKSPKDTKGDCGGQQKTAIIALGELYRWALQNVEAGSFGSDGIQWLQSQTSRQADPDSECQEVATRYREILEGTKEVNYNKHGGFLQSIKRNDLTAALTYLTRRSSTVTPEERGEALCLAAERAWSEVVLALIDLGTEVDCKDQNSLAALSHAAIEGNAEIVSLLIDAGASPVLVDKEDRSALSYASEMGHEPVVQRLLSDPRTFSDQKDMSGRTPLSYAADNGHEAVVRLLLEKGAAVDTQDENKKTALLYAADKGHEAVVRLLLEKGAAVDAQDQWKQTALLYAAGSGHEAVVRLLLEKGAAVDTQDQWERTALSYAAGNGHEAVVRLLLEKGAAVDTQDRDKQTAL
ncbi:hypothetical protein KXW16_006644, partial [Aspergillus fumigatus]